MEGGRGVKGGRGVEGGKGVEGGMYYTEGGGYGIYGCAWSVEHV